MKLMSLIAAAAVLAATVGTTVAPVEAKPMMMGHHMMRHHMMHGHRMMHPRMMMRRHMMHHRHMMRRM